MDKQITENSEDVIDIAEHASAGKPVPRGRRYRIRIDKDSYTVDQSHITGKEILALAGKRPEEYHLYQHLRGGETRAIEADTRVDLEKPGLERFTTIRIQNQEG